MLVKFKKNKMLELQGILNGKLLLEYRKVKFSYAISKIREKINSECELISKALAFDPELLALLDVKVIEGMSYAGLLDYIQSLEVSEENKKKLTEKTHENINFLESESEIEIFDLIVDHLPDNISENDYRILKPIIKE